MSDRESREVEEMESATREEVRLMLHMLGSSHPGSPLGWRNYGAFHPEDPRLLRMLDKGLVRLSGERWGSAYYHVTDDWARALGAEVTP